MALMPGVPMNKPALSLRDRIRGVGEVFRTLAKHRIVTLLLAAFVFVLSELGHTAVSKVTQMLVPQLDDTNQIISNQNKQFADVKTSLDQLASKLSGQEGEQLAALRDAVVSAQAGSENVAARLSQLILENQNLRKVLHKEKGIEGGVDLLVPLRDGYKIDATNSMGFMSIDNYGGVHVSLTSLNAGESIANQYLSMGQGIPFTNASRQKCQLIYLGSTKVEGSTTALAKFALPCGGAAAEPGA